MRHMEVVHVVPGKVLGMTGALGPLLAARPSELVVANRTLDKARVLVERHAGVAGDTRLAAAPTAACGRGFDVVVNATATSLQRALLSELALADQRSGFFSVALALFLGTASCWGQCVMCFRTAAAQNAARAHLMNLGIVAQKLGDLSVARARYDDPETRRLGPYEFDEIERPVIVAQAADTSVQYLRYLNPHLRSNMTPPEPYVVMPSAPASVQLASAEETQPPVQAAGSEETPSPVPAPSWPFRRVVAQTSPGFTIRPATTRAPQAEA